MLKLFVLFVCLGAAYVSGDSTPIIQPSGSAAAVTKTLKPTVLPTMAATSSSMAPKPSSSSMAPKPSPSSKAPKPSPSSMDPKPSPSSKAPKPSPSSKAPKPSPSSKAPKPSSSMAPSSSINPSSSSVMPTATPTPMPTPTPPPHGNFSLQDDKTKKYCLLAEFAVTFTVNYMARVLKFNSTNTTIDKQETTTIFLNRNNSHDVVISGDCGLKSGKANLTVSWPKKSSYYELTMLFDQKTKVLEAGKNISSWTVGKISLRVTLEGNKDFSPNATEKVIMSSYNGSTVPSGEVGGYYMCEDATDLKLNTGVEDYSVDAAFQDLKVEPFVNKTKDDDFGKNVKECIKDHPTPHTTTTGPPDNNDIVPIAVGCALAGLVLIVLIAYVIGRRKSHRGYEKV